MTGSVVSTTPAVQTAPVQTYTYAAPMYSSPMMAQPYLPYDAKMIAEQQTRALELLGTQASCTLTAATQQYTAQKTMLQQQREHELQALQASLSLQQSQQLQPLEQRFAQRKAEIEAARMAESAQIDYTAMGYAMALGQQQMERTLQEQVAKASGAFLPPVVSTLSGAAVESAKTRSAELLKLQADAALKQAEQQYALEKQMITGECQRALEATKQSLVHAQSAEQLQLTQAYEQQKSLLEQAKQQQALALESAAQAMKSQAELSKLALEAQKLAPYGGMAAYAPTYVVAPATRVSAPQA